MNFTVNASGVLYVDGGAHRVVATDTAAVVDLLTSLGYPGYALLETTASGESIYGPAPVTRPTGFTGSTRSGSTLQKKKSG